MIVGIIISSVGAGLLLLLSATTPTVEWAAYIVLNRLGIGLAQQLPYTALQAVLELEDTATGNAIAVFSWQLGGAVAVAIGQNIFLNELYALIPAYAPEVSAVQVVDVGAGGLKDLRVSGETLRRLREAYAEALRSTFVLPLVGTCLALPFAVGMQWLNIKKIAEERRQKRGQEMQQPEADKT